MQAWSALTAIARAATGWNFCWGIFDSMTEHEVRTLPPVAFPSDGHRAITGAAIRVLPEEDLAYLEPEAELLADVYCGFPDQNWMTYGEFSEAAIYDERFPDCRRAWDISGYCLFHPLTKAGEFIGHGPPTSPKACQKLLPFVLEAFRGGRHRDAVRHLGVLLHYVEDSGTPGHVIETKGELHTALDAIPDDLVNIDGYEPRLLADAEDELADAIMERVGELIEYVRPRAERMIARFETEGIEPLRDLHAECANECARASADVVHTILHQVKDLPKRVHEPSPAGVELLSNGSFELDYDWDGVPDGWLVRWHDLDDREVVAERTSEQRYAGLWSVKLAKTPAAGVEWIPAWPQAIDVEPGQIYELTAYVRAEQATGKSFLIAYFHREDTTEVARERGQPLNGGPAEAGWRRLELRLTVPEGAARMLVGLRSEGNSGAVWFDSVSLVRLDL